MVLVSHAESLGLVIILCVTSDAYYQPHLPTAQTSVAWQALAAQFGSDDQVIFDLFNEPTTTDIGWKAWLNGGTVNGIHYYGMQYVAQYLRGLGAQNLFWAQGLQRASSLEGIPQWHLTGVGPVAYSIHRPPAPHTPAQWDIVFGFLVGTYAVVAGEWADYARSNAPWACWDDAPTAVPAFLNYLAANGVGLVGWNLEKGHLLESNNLIDAAHIKSDWACVDGLNEGAGHQIKEWFIRQNTK